MPRRTEGRNCHQFDELKKCKEGKECKECKKDNDQKNAKNAKIAFTGKMTKNKNAEKKECKR